MVDQSLAVANLRKGQRAFLRWVLAISERLVCYLFSATWFVAMPLEILRAVFAFRAESAKLDAADVLLVIPSAEESG